jgi:hypothetical protein
MNVAEIGWCGTDRIDVAHDMGQWKDLVNEIMNLQVP